MLPRGGRSHDREHIAEIGRDAAFGNKHRPVLVDETNAELARHVGRGVHRLDAGHFERVRRIDGHDLGARVIGELQRGMEQPGLLHIVDEGSSPDGEIASLVFDATRAHTLRKLDVEVLAFRKRFDGIENFDVTRASTEVRSEETRRLVAFQILPLRVEERLGAHDDAWRTESALESATGCKRARVAIDFGVVHAFEGDDVFPFDRVERLRAARHGVVAPLWLRANAPMVVAEVCSTMKYPKRSQYKHAKQKKYHVRNWAEYNEGLRRRGDLTVWFDEEAIANWMADKTGKPGGQRVYSDLAIETSLVVRMVYKLAYRQTEGFLNSIASLLGLGIEIPDYSTLCRRSRLLRKKLRIPKAASSQPIHLMIDSTGLRIHVGTARKPPKQRAWRKLHIAVDRKTGNIVASELTASRARDATRVPALLTQIQAPLVSVAADSAYDKEAVYETIEAHSPGRRTRVVIPPQRNATLSQNSNTAMQERDRHIRAIERHGRREWYKLSGCTKRSMVENAVYRYKAIIGPEMRTRTLARQRVEHRIGCEILNKMTALGMPDTYCAG